MLQETPAEKLARIRERKAKKFIERNASKVRYENEIRSEKIRNIDYLFRSLARTYYIPGLNHNKNVVEELTRLFDANELTESQENMLFEWL